MVSNMPDARALTPGLRDKRRLALICDSLEDIFQAELVEAGLAAAAAHDVDLVIVPGGKLGESVGKNFIHDLVPRWAEGIIVAAHTIGHTATERELARFLDDLRPIPTVALGVVTGADCCLSIDNERAAYDLTQHLVVQHRYERFAYLSGPPGNPESMARESGFARALREAGLEVPPERRLVGDFTRDGGRLAMVELIDGRGVAPKALQALVCANDASAVGAIGELERRGYRIPTDLAVVGFDDTEIAKHLPAPLTTVRQPLGHLLFDAVRLLVEGLAVGRAPRGSFRFDAEPILRRSCGCPRLPNLPRPSTPDRLDPAGPPTLRRMESALRKELDESFVAAVDRIDPGWLGDVLEALGTQLAEQGTVFYDTVEALCFGMLRERKPTSGWQNALLVLRRHVARRGVRPELLLDLDRLIDGAIRLASELTTSFIARQREELLEHMRILGDATAGLLAAPDLNTIAEVTRSSFPKLGVERGLIYLFTSDYGAEVSMVPLSSFGMGEGATAPAASSTGPGLDELACGQSWVIEPLGTGQRPLGVAVLQAGLSHASWYERLRDALTAAINGAQLNQRVQRLVITDPLTGLSNRRFLTQTLRQELDPECSHRQPLSLLVLDLDGFKSINDEFGHDEGDRALIQAADSIKRCLRDTDTLARFGGDEFVAVLPGASAEQAKAIAGRVLERLPPDLRAAFSTALTCSIGIATIERDGKTGDAELFRRADQALLAAKRAGKNRAVHARELTA